jgi:hypothetical protein
VSKKKKLFQKWTHKTQKGEGEEKGEKEGPADEGPAHP